MGRVALVVPAGVGMSPEKSASLLAEGAVLGAYKFDRYKTAAKKSKAGSPLRIVFVRKVQSIANLRARVKQTVEVADSQLLARDLSNEPPNSIYP